MVMYVNVCMPTFGTTVSALWSREEAVDRWIDGREEGERELRARCPFAEGSLLLPSFLPSPLVVAALFFSFITFPLS